MKQKSKNPGELIYKTKQTNLFTEKKSRNKDTSNIGKERWYITTKKGDFFFQVANDVLSP